MALLRHDSQRAMTNDAADSRDGERGAQRTWNAPEDIERNRRLTPEERLRKAIALSRAALRFASAERTRGG
jgi:hypothetical protein